MQTAVFHMIAGAPQLVALYSRAVECDGWVFVTSLARNARIEIDCIARRP